MHYNPNSTTSSLNKTRAVEWLLSMCAIAWGLAMLQPSDLFEAPSYRLLYEILRDTTWAALAICIGSLRLLGLMINGWWRRSPLIRAAGSFASGFFWMFVAILMIAAAKKTGASLPPGVVYYPLFFAFEGWCLLAAGYDMQKSGSLASRGR